MSEHDAFEQIKSGKARMKSKRYFVALAVLQFVVTIAVLALLLYVASFILFVLHENSAALGVYFGLSGWLIFIRSLPWIAVFLLIVLILLLALLMRRYRLIYYQPVFYILFIIILFLSLGSLVIAATSFHSSFLGYLEGRSSFLTGFYQHEEVPASGIYHGAIVSMQMGGFILADSTTGVTSTVILPAGVSPEFVSTLMPGDSVVVFGTRDARGTINAFGIDKTF